MGIAGLHNFMTCVAEHLGKRESDKFIVIHEQDPHGKASGFTGWSNLWKKPQTCFWRFVDHVRYRTLHGFVKTRFGTPTRCGLS